MRGRIADLPNIPLPKTVRQPEDEWFALPCEPPELEEYVAADARSPRRAGADEEILEVIASRLDLGALGFPDVRASLAWQPDEGARYPDWHAEEGRVRQVLLGREALFKLYQHEYAELGFPRLETEGDRLEVNMARLAVWKELMPGLRRGDGWFDPMQWRPKLELLNPWAVFDVVEAMVTQEEALASVGVTDIVLVARALEIQERDRGGGWVR